MVSKNAHLVFLTTFLKIFQSLTCFETLYFSSSLWHSLYYHNFKCIVILIIFGCLNQIFSILSANSYTICSRFSLLEMCSVFSPLMNSMSLARKLFSSLLFLMIIYFLVWICFSIIAISTVSGVWSDSNLHSRQIIWLSGSDEVG